MTIPTVTSPAYFDFAELLAPYVDDQRTLLRLTNSVVDKANEVTRREVSDAEADATERIAGALDVRDEEIALLRGRLAVAEDQRNDLHEMLTNVARTSETVMGFVRNNQKINAIKELRRLTNASLKATKDAVEDPRVWAPFEVVGVMHVGTD